MSIDGFRPQSAAERQLANVRLARDDGRDRIVFIANVLEQPAQDPLGLTRAQFEADPWQTATIALPQGAPGQPDRFNTRKDTAQSQAGVSWRHRLAAGALAESQLAAWSGQRAVTQWQSIPVATQFNATTPTITERHPGGVIDFDRRYGGLDGRLVWRWALAGDRRLQLVAGAALESAREERRGFENFSGPAATRLLGVTGRLRRDESNRLDSRDAFFQADWDIAADWALAAGLRATRVRYASTDRYIVGGNGDDSGELSYSARSPVVSLQWRVAESLRAYLSLGRGFEAPTLGEVAYRPDGGTGFNNTLLPQTSRQAELGLKWRSAAGVALDLALFEARTADEIAVATNRGGRSTFRNVGRTTRRGAELALALPLGAQWRSSLALTVLDARYDSAFAVCAALPCLTPTLPVPAGNRIAGTQPKSLFAELVWQPLTPLELAVEVRGLGRVPVNDLNSDFAGGHGLLGLRARWTQVLPAGRLELQARIDNLANRAVAGSVIVSDANGRFFEPAPPRAGLVSLRWAVAWP
jgi:iron complex outermembrane receptor protein